MKCEALSRTLSHFRDEYNKINNARARMLDSIYHMTRNCLLLFFWREHVKFLW